MSERAAADTWLVGAELDLQPGTLGPSAVAIGNFDGVHRGHASVIAALAAESRRVGASATVLTFDPHPAVVLGRAPPPLLTPLERKATLLRRAGVERVVVRAFSLELASWTPARFAEELLAARLAARHVIVGENFRFGHRRAGDVNLLAELGSRLGFSVSSAPLLADEVGTLSSTRVRAAIAAGDVEVAAAMLGRLHAISGEVVHGDARGRTLGFPTANLGDVVEELPLSGVYAVAVDELGASEEEARGVGLGVMNVGVRPTVGDGAVVPRVEVHLFDFAGDLYGRRLRVSLVRRLRGERRFAGLDELRAQIARDCVDARAATAGLAPNGRAYA